MLTYVPLTVKQKIAVPPQSEKPWLLLLLCVLWLLPGLVGHDPWKPVENQCVAVVAQLLAGQDWAVPLLAGQPYLEFGPLYYWSAALLGHVLAWLGVSLHDAVRLSTGVWMALALWGVGLAGRELHGRRQGRMAVLVLVGSIGLLLWGHHASPAVLALAAIAWQVYALALARRNSLLAGMLLGAAWCVLLLGANWGETGVAMLAALLLLPFSPWRRSGYLAVLLAAFVIALPLGLLWPLYLQQQAPEVFALWWQQHALGAFGGLGVLSFFHRPGYLPSIIAWFTFPALPLAAWAVWWSRSHLREARWLMPLLLLGVVLLALVLAGRPTEVQALLLLPPLAVLAAGGIDELRRGAASALVWFGTLTFSVVALLLWAGWLVLLTGQPAPLAETLQQMSPGYQPRLGVGVLFALGISIGWWRVLQGKRPLGRRAVASWAAGLTLVWGLQVGLWQPWLDVSKSYRAVGEGVRGAAASVSGCVAVQHFGTAQQGGVSYFSGRQLLAEGGATCPLHLQQGAAVDPLLGELLWSGSRPGEKSEHFFLYRRQP